MLNQRLCGKLPVPEGHNKDIDCDIYNMSQSCPHNVPLYPITHIPIGLIESAKAGTLLSKMSSEHYGTHLSLFIERVSRVVSQKSPINRFVASCSSHG